MKYPKILFMGTPEFAVPSLRALLEREYPVVGVVTQPDKPKGRGRKPMPPPVKIFAQERGIPVYQPERVRDTAFLDQFRACAPDIVVLVAFGQILPPEIIQGPRMGCVNVHPSLLPQYRGAAPINWPLIAGEKKTGVTIIYMAEEVDAGDIILQKEEAIAEEDSFDDLYRRLSVMGADLLVAAVESIVGGRVSAVPQDHSQATFAPRITPETGYIDWNKGVEDIVNLIRGLSSTPAAYSFLREKKLKIFSAVGVPKKTSGEKPPGTIGQLMEAGLQITAGDGHVYLRDIQLEGRRRMAIDEFLRGFRLIPGDILE